MNVVTQTVVLVGLESSGKSSLFRIFTGQQTGDETNFRGSTVKCRRAKIKNQPWEIVDTPGIKVKDDSLTTKLAMVELNKADVVLLVVRGTHATSELKSLLFEIKEILKRFKTGLIITFADKCPDEIKTFAEFCKSQLGIPSITINARLENLESRSYLFDLIDSAQTPQLIQITKFKPPELAVVSPQETFYEKKIFGPVLAIFSMILLFGLPIYAAYILASWLQPVIDENFVNSMTEKLNVLFASNQFLASILLGKYGVLTLGWYSFLWAFPVVLFVAVSVAVAEETGLKDRITTALDGWLRFFGLSGRDLIPILTGFGCNVVAVYQSRNCSSCTRKNCVSLITFGAACSYQIGASLSLFNVAGKPWLFIPYLFLTFVIGVLHTKIWHMRAVASSNYTNVADRAFLQMPSFKSVWWRVKATVKQFLLRAMPIFLIICVVSSILVYLGAMEKLVGVFNPLAKLLQLPQEVVPGILFSIIRKDGLLMLNESGGAVIKQLSTGQLFLLVYLASTFTACMVTIWTVGKEMGLKYTFKLVGSQMLSSIISTIILWFIFDLMQL
jgi:ferrous iron transport protein B